MVVRCWGEGLMSEGWIDFLNIYVCVISKFF